MIKKQEIYTTMESDYYINFVKQTTCKDCPFIEGLDLDKEENWEQS